MVDRLGRALPCICHRASNDGMDLSLIVDCHVRLRHTLAGVIDYLLGKRRLQQRLEPRRYHPGLGGERKKGVSGRQMDDAE